MSVDIDLSQYSLDDLMALAKRANEIKKDMLDADATRLGAEVQSLADIVLVEREVQSAPKSGWHGVKVFGLPVTGPDGRKFTASVTFSDVEATDTAKAEIKAKLGPAYDAHLAAVAKGSTETETEGEGEGEGDSGEGTGEETPADAPKVDLVKPGAKKK